jgi:hypothetical protein
MQGPLLTLHQFPRSETPANGSKVFSSVVTDPKGGKQERAFSLKTTHREWNYRGI